MITLEQIRAAQNNDLDGISAVLAEMDDRLCRLATQTAGSMATNRARYTDYVDEFRQDAMVSLFEYLPRWQGTSVDAFRAYIYSAVGGDLKVRAHAERNSGIDRDAISVFKAMVEQANGDVHEAERMSQTVPPKGRRLSADRAFAARIAWQGSVSIDKTSDDNDGAAIIHTLAVSDETPDVIHPKVGTGAVREAAYVLYRYATAPRAAEDAERLNGALAHMLRSGHVTLETLAAVEDTVRVPAGPTERRYVLDAVGIICSAASTATDGDLAEELRNAADCQRDQRADTIGNVRAVVAEMSAQQANALRLTFGLDGNECYGNGDGADVDGFAEALGTSVNAARVARSKAFRSFADRWIARVAKTLAGAELWADAAANSRKRGGRK